MSELKVVEFTKTEDGIKISNLPYLMEGIYFAREDGSYWRKNYVWVNQEDAVANIHCANEPGLYYGKMLLRQRRYYYKGKIATNDTLNVTQGSLMARPVCYGDCKFFDLDKLIWSK